MEEENKLALYKRLFSRVRQNLVWFSSLYTWREPELLSLLFSVLTTIVAPVLR